MKLVLSMAFVLAGIVVACSSSTSSGGGGDIDAGGDSSTVTDSGTDSATDSATDAGADAAVTRTWTCSFMETHFAPGTTHASNCSDTSLHVNGTYTATESPSGDVTVMASITLPTPAVSASQMWTSGTAGADDASATLDDDICRGADAGVAGPGSWTFTLDKPTSTLTSLYTDADLIAGSYSVTTLCTLTTTP